MATKKIKFDIESREGEEDRTTISINGIGEVVLVETFPEYEFLEDIDEDTLEELNVEEGDLIGKIEHLEINDEYKGQGYAKILMNKAIELAKEKGLMPLYLNASPMGSKRYGLDVDDLTGFYESLGFEVFLRQGGNNLMILKDTYKIGGETKNKIMSKQIKMQFEDNYANGGVTYSEWSKDDFWQEQFNDWKKDGNVSKNANGTYSTQDAQYRNSLRDMSALKRYFYNEFIKGQYDSYAGGGSLDDKHLVAKAIEYITGNAIDEDSIQFEADEIAFKYKSSNKTWTTISQKLIKDTISMHRKSLENRYEEGGEVEYEIKRIVNEAKNQKGNTHFAIHKPTNSIVFSWDYSEYDTKELNENKDDYFYIDVKDNVSGNIDKYIKSDFAIVQRKDLEKRGIDLNNYLVFIGQKYDSSESNYESDGVEAGFDDAGTSMVLYHEKNGNWLVPKGQVYLYLYDVENSGSKLGKEFDWVFYPLTSQSMAWQSGYIPPLKKIWTKKFQKDHKGSEHLLGVIKAYLIEKDGKKELFIDIMSVNPSKKKKGIMSYMIKELRDTFKLEQDQVTFSKLTDEGKKFVEKKTYADGGWVLVDTDTERKLGEYETESEARKNMYEYEGNSNILEKSFFDKLPPNPNRHSPAYNFADGGGAVDCIEYIKNSESIKNNGYYLHFDNMNNYVSSNSVNIPKINSLCMITFNSGGQKNLKAVDTITSTLLASEIAKLLNIDIEMARIIVYEQTTSSKPFTMDMLDGIKNQNIIVADRDTIVCTNLPMKFADGGDTEKVYIEFLNKEKGFKKDTKYFNSYEEAVKWARENFEKFNPDMIKYKFADGGSADEEINFFVVINEDDKNYNKVGYSLGETITDKEGNEFEKLYFENQKLPKKYNVNDISYLSDRGEFSKKNKITGTTNFVILVDYQEKEPYFYIYNLTEKFVATEGYNWSSIIKSAGIENSIYAHQIFDDGGDVRKMSWTERFRDKIPFEMVIVAKESEKDGGNEIVFNLLVEAQNDVTAYQEARKKWNEQYESSDMSIKKVYTKKEFKNLNK